MISPDTPPPFTEPVLARSPAPRKIDSVQLFAGQRQVTIVHQGEAYTLRITRQDKLILTK